jgi:uncharacterized protein YdhG (YjbR/CyaY superfamily)
MSSQKKRPADVNEYIQQAPKEAQAKLRSMRACIRKAAPGATESLKYGMPAFSQQRMLVAYAAFKHHIGFYPTASPVKVFAKELSKYHTAKGSIQFPMDEPLPLPLIRKITRFRVKEESERQKSGKTGRGGRA